MRYVYVDASKKKIRTRKILRFVFPQSRKEIATVKEGGEWKKERPKMEPVSNSSTWMLMYIQMAVSANYKCALISAGYQCPNKKSLKVYTTTKHVKELQKQI